MRLTLLVIVVVVVGALIAWPMLARGRAVAGAPPVTAGPFTIETNVRRISAGGFPNTSGNPFATQPTTDYAVRLRGKKIAIPLADGRPLDRFWEARVLDGAPRPAILVGQLGVWLLTEDGDQLVVTTLAPPDPDFSTLQWLDADAGQPGAEAAIAMREAPEGPRTLSGGRYLLVDRANVLDVDTLQAHAFDPYADPAALDGYSPSGDPARAVSPDGRQIVFIATRNAGMDHEYALVAVDYRDNRSVVAPFPRTFTRFDSVWDFDREWFAHYFAWAREADGYRLQLRKDVDPLPWRGRLSRLDGGMVEYRVRPVARGLLPVLAEFVERHEGAQRLASDDPDRIDLRLGDDVLHAWYRAEAQELSLYADLGPRQREAWARIERIGPAFDAELATRRHDALFGSLDAAP
jgi:hypothetical protein